MAERGPPAAQRRRSGRRQSCSAVSEKRRADQLLVERGLAESRARAQALILAGRVSAGGRRVDKPGEQVAGAVALDIGASTGGFTDVLLAHGARRVYAVDVGHGQLAWKLRQDPRVVV